MTRLCSCPSPSGCWDDSSSLLSLNWEPKSEAGSLKADASCGEGAERTASLEARLQSHLQSNIGVRHLDIFTLMSFMTVVILPQHAGQGDMSSAIIPAPFPL